MSRPRTTPEPPKRLRAVDVIDKLLERRSATSESVSLRRNAKGDVQIEVEAVVLDGESLADASARCRAVYDGLAALYPMQANGGEAKWGGSLSS